MEVGNFEIVLHGGQVGSYPCSTGFRWIHCHDHETAFALWWCIIVGGASIMKWQIKAIKGCTWSPTTLKWAVLFAFLSLSPKLNLQFSVPWFCTIFILQNINFIWLRIFMPLWHILHIRMPDIHGWTLLFLLALKPLLLFNPLCFSRPPPSGDSGFLFCSDGELAHEYLKMAH